MVLKKNYFYLISGIIFVSLYSFVIIYIPQATQVVLDSFSSNNNNFYNSLFILTLAIIFKIILEMIYIYIFQKLGNEISIRCNEAVIKKIQNQTLSYITTINIGNITELLETDVKNVQKFISATLPMIIHQIILVSGVILSILKYGIIPFFLFLIIISFSFIILLKFKKKDETLIKEERDFSNYVYENYLNWIRNRKIINIFNLESKIENNYQAFNKSWFNKKIKSQNYIYNIWALSTLLGDIFMFASLFLGGYLFLGNKISIGTVYMFYQYGQLLLTPLSYMQSILQNYKQYKVSRKRILDFLKIPVDIEYGAENLQSINSLDINHLNYSLEGNIILNDITISIKCNQCIAFMGVSGVGKSTLMKLISKIINPPRNTIFLNKIDINQYNSDSFHSKIVYLSNEPFIINATLKDNLTLFNNEISNKEIEDVLEGINFTSFFDYPIELSSLINRNCNEISSTLEFQQLINLTRILFLKKDLIILDEAFSSITKRNFLLLKLILSKICKDKIVLLVSHDRSLCDLLGDKIILLEKGTLLK